jgi:bifunctional DNA-binding transcriptional regulator/antitoxin component of YhaV-PrlF toxin-antitoxin module
MTTARTTLGDRGLLRLPASVRNEAGLGQGDEIIVIAAGPGRIVLTTRAAIQDEVWAAAPTPATTTSTRAERDADREAVAAKSRRVAAQLDARTEEESERIGEMLLSRFGA